MTHKKIFQEDVYNLLIGTSFDWNNPMNGAINIVNMSHLLQTSKYQVKKYINELVKLGLIELQMFMVPDDDEIFPPYWGYVLTEEGKKTSVYKARLEHHESTWKKWVESMGVIEHEANI